MIRHALLDAPTDSVTTLVAVAKDDFDRWRDSQTAAVRTWLERIRFKNDVGTIAWLPVAADGPTRALVITSSDALTAVADLPYRLPEGDYQLESEFAGADLERAVLGWGLGAYRFNRYKKSERNPARLFAQQGIEPAIRQLDAIALVRDLINTPASDMLPSDLAAAAQALAAEFDAECAITVGEALLERGLPMIHAVGRASVNEPRLIDMRWGDVEHPKVVLIGKGVCFDSGGLDIKGAANMRLMKKDMGGAAHALGLARLVMANALPVALRVLIPAVENAVAGNAFRPGDIIETRNGTTVEIDNTDAEGRLVLCDALALACEESPALIIDFATLTGSARSALGTDLPAMFANDDAVARGIEESGRAVGDLVWRLPLHQPYRKLLDSKAADMTNSASSPYAGAIVAALFLESFVATGTPWAHFDLMAWNTSTQPGRPEGGEAMGLRAVYAHLAARFGHKV